MTQRAVTPEALDYLSGSLLDFGRLAPVADWRALAPAGRSLTRIVGVGLDPAPDDLRAGAPLSEPLLAGLCGEGIPFAFRVVGHDNVMEFSVGTWVNNDADERLLNSRQRVVNALVGGLFPAIDLEPADPWNWPGDLLPIAGLVHGLPRIETGGVHRGVGATPGPAPWDRLLRSMWGARFGVLVLAEPIDPATIVHLRNVAIEDERAALSAEDSGTPTPIARVYSRQLDELVLSLNRAIAVGGWRTAVYLLGDEDSYWRLSAAFRATFSNADSMIMQLRTAAPAWTWDALHQWALPYTGAPAGPRGWQHPFLNQTLLDSSQLAALAHLPRLDVSGFTVRPAPSFSVSRHPVPPGVPAVQIGAVVDQQRITSAPYAVETRQLPRHVFVSGVTGSGKTNTVMHLLRQASDQGIPYLVIEPAKSEYRQLLREEVRGGAVRVFTLGREEIAPLRLNPFDVPPGIDLSTHVDLVKAAFAAGMALWIPLPQVLERCLIQIYEERGWRFGAGAGVGAGTGSPAPGPGARSVPTLSDLAAAVGRVVPTLGFKDETAQEISAALTTRIDALRTGGRGLMLDVERSIPMSELLAAPTIIELEGLGDDADKAFVMGLLLTRLYEHLRSVHAEERADSSLRGRPSARAAVRHLVVVEEAHRLLGSTRKLVDSWHADPQGAFVDVFTQMLAEVRAYGEGVVIADQVPTRLAPDVLKNTNLKIIHRLVAKDDRDAVSETMSMTSEQSEALQLLPPGRAAVFSEGDHAASMVQIPPPPDGVAQVGVDDLDVARQMSAWRQDPRVGVWFVARRGCSAVCTDVEICQAARLLADLPAGRALARRLLHTSWAHTDGLDVGWPEVRAFVACHATGRIDPGGLTRAFVGHGLAAALDRRSNQGGWSPDDTAALHRAVREVLDERMAGPQPWLGATRSRKNLLALAGKVERRTYDPLPLCRSVCTDARCPFRDGLDDALLALRTRPAPTSGPAGPVSADLFRVASELAGSLVDLGPQAPAGREPLAQARWRAVACAAQLLACVPSERPLAAAELVTTMLAENGWTL